MIRQLDARRAAIIAPKGLPRGEKTSARVSIVTECVTQSMPVLTPQKVQCFCSHTEAFVLKCASKLPM